MVLSLLFISLGIICQNAGNTTGHCKAVTENNFFDPECGLGLLGCNAGGLNCCRFCGFGVYENVTCPASPPVRPPAPPSIPSPPFPPVPSSPPFPPKPCRRPARWRCDSSVENNYFDSECYSYSDKYGGLGCNAGGLKCCRFCGFGVYGNITCPIGPPVPPAPPRMPLVIEPIDVFIPPRKSRIEFNIRIRETIETFDKPKFKRRLRKVFKKVPEEDINIRVRPGSIIIDVTLIANDTIVDNTTGIINGMTESTLSEALNVSVIELSSPVTTVPEPIEEEPVYSSFPLFMLSMVLCMCTSVTFCCNYKRLYCSRQPSNRKVLIQDPKHLNGLLIINEETDDEIRQLV